MFSRIVSIKACRWLCIVLLFWIAKNPAIAHEFWLEPSHYRVDQESVIEAYLRNGEEFSGSAMPYLKATTRRFELLSAGRVDSVVARIGDSPALKMQAVQSGLNVVVHQSSTSIITYNKWDKFQRFAEHKDFPDILARHRARSLPEKDFKEAYTRYSKSLIAVGHGKGSDRQAGLEIELVAQHNPYVDDLSGGVRIVGYYQNKIRPNAQIELFEKSPAGDVTVTLHRTDDQGLVTLPVKPSHSYLVDMVVLREPAKALFKKKEAVWETLWATLTFAVP